MLDLLRLITPDSPTIDAEKVCAVHGCGFSTAYRYIRELTNAGLLVKLPGGYALGPRIIQLDLQMRQTDPVLFHGRDLLRELVQETGMSALVSELYGNEVITLHEEVAHDMQALDFGRGRAMPLHRGATGRVIMAHLSPRQLRRIHDAVAVSGDGGLPPWREFTREMLALRKEGYCLTRGQIEVDRVGLAAPLFDERRRVLGSVSLVGEPRRFEMFNESLIAGLVRAAAAKLSQRIAEQPVTAASLPAGQQRMNSRGFAGHRLRSSA